jgi:hypothetical protein
MTILIGVMIICAVTGIVWRANPIALIDSKSVAKLVNQPQTGGVSQALSNVQALPGLETTAH